MVFAMWCAPLLQISVWVTQIVSASVQRANLNRAGRPGSCRESEEQEDGDERQRKLVHENLPPAAVEQPQVTFSVSVRDGPSALHPELQEAAARFEACQPSHLPPSFLAEAAKLLPCLMRVKGRKSPMRVKGRKAR